jgi:hypothetical protein
MSQTDNNNFNLRLPIRLAGLALLLATAGALAGTAFHRDTLHPSDFVCKDGFRFMVETHRDHLRLRTGAGVFSLVEENARADERQFNDMRRYSDGNNVLWTDGLRAHLQTHEADDYHDCAIAAQVES